MYIYTYIYISILHWSSDATIQCVGVCCSAWQHSLYNIYNMFIYICTYIYIYIYILH